MADKSYYTPEDLPKGAEIPTPLVNRYAPVKLKGKNRINVLALGDVGITATIGLILAGSHVIESIGIYDINGNNLRRMEMELNQIYDSCLKRERVTVNIVKSEEDLWDCDVFIFAAGVGVPTVNFENDAKDPRMAQLAENRKLAQHYGKSCGKAGFKGLVAMVSDPVDLLAYAFFKASGLDAEQIQGFGLGVMAGRAAYFAKKEEKFREYASTGDVFGPHGEGLVVANSLVPELYDEALSEELTRLTVTANLRVRELGYKPYIAPAISSAALSIIKLLEGKYHYSSLYLGNMQKGAFIGIKNIMKEGGAEFYPYKWNEELYCRIKRSYNNLIEEVSKW